MHTYPRKVVLQREVERLYCELGESARTLLRQSRFDTLDEIDHRSSLDQFLSDVQVPMLTGEVKRRVACSTKK